MHPTSGIIDFERELAIAEITRILRTATLTRLGLILAMLQPTQKPPRFQRLRPNTPKPGRGGRFLLKGGC